MKRGRTGRRLVVAGLLLGLCWSIPQDVYAQDPVVIDLNTDCLNDTVYVGVPANIIFSVDANGNQVQSLVIGGQLTFTGGNWLGPISDTAGSVVPSDSAVSIFNSIAWNPNFGQGTDPDTMIYGFTSFGGPWSISNELFRIRVTASGQGTFALDTLSPLPPASSTMAAQDPGGASLPIDWRGDGKLIHATELPNCGPVCQGVTQSATLIEAGDLISGEITVFDPTCQFAVYDYHLVSAVNSQGTGPHNPIALTGPFWSWQTSDIDSLDWGVWTLTFGYSYLCYGSDVCQSIQVEVVDSIPPIVLLTGDADGSGTLTSADIIYLVNYIFKTGPDPLPCIAVGDFNCNGAVTSADLIELVNHVFKGMDPPCDINLFIPGIWQCP